jgi:hypothetical protein
VITWPKADFSTHKQHRYTIWISIWWAIFIIHSDYLHPWSLDLFLTDKTLDFWVCCTTLCMMHDISLLDILCLIFCTPVQSPCVILEWTVEHSVQPPSTILETCFGALCASASPKYDIEYCFLEHSLENIFGLYCMGFPQVLGFSLSVILEISFLSPSA